MFSGDGFRAGCDFSPKNGPVPGLCRPPARAVVATDCEPILAGSEEGLVGSYELPADDRCRAVWQQLREILADALGVKAEVVTLKSRLIADLGAG